MGKQVKHLLRRYDLYFYTHLTLHTVPLQHGRTLRLIKEKEVAPLMKMRLWSAPGPDHDLVKLLVKLQAVPCQRNVTGGSILLAHPAHTHWRRGPGIGGVSLDDD